MAQTPVSGNHSFQNYDGWSRYKTPATFTWGSGGSTCTVTDPKVTTNSVIDLNVTGTVPQAGFWAISTSVGSFTITSSDGESSTLTVAYVII